MLQTRIVCVLLLEYVVMADDYTEYVKRAVAGDKQAFGELYKIFLNRIYRFIYYLVGDEFLAEDIAQNTFLKAWNSLPDFSIERGTFQSYIYTIARNLVIDNQRRKKDVSLEGKIGDRIVSKEDPVEGFSKDESMQKVRDALKTLPDFDRELVVLRFFEDMQFDEISKILGKNSGALRVRIHRVLETLRENLEGKV